MNKVEWTIKIKRQEKTKNGNVILNGFLSGKKHEDGEYDTPMWMSVIITNKGKYKTKWKAQDLTDQWVTVEGNFTHADWNNGEKSGKSFTIFANSIAIKEFDDEFVEIDDDEESPFIEEEPKKKSTKKAKF